jgi:hypothetical protein
MVRALSRYCSATMIQSMSFHASLERSGITAGRHKRCVPSMGALPLMPAIRVAAPIIWVSCHRGPAARETPMKIVQSRAIIHDGSERRD